MKTTDILLIETCPACPEQYDAVLEETGKRIAFLHLRHGHFTVEIGGPFGELVYESWPDGDGMFEDSERWSELMRAKQSIVDWYTERSGS